MTTTRGGNALLRKVFDCATDADKGEIVAGRNLDEDIDWFVSRHGIHDVRGLIHGRVPDLETAVEISGEVGIDCREWLCEEDLADPYAGLPKDEDKELSTA